MEGNELTLAHNKSYSKYVMKYAKYYNLYWLIKLNIGEVVH